MENGAIITFFLMEKHSERVNFEVMSTGMNLIKVSIFFKIISSSLLYSPAKT